MEFLRLNPACSVPGHKYTRNMIWLARENATTDKFRLCGI